MSSLLGSFNVTEASISTHALLGCVCIMSLTYSLITWQKALWRMARCMAKIAAAAAWRLRWRHEKACCGVAAAAAARFAPKSGMAAAAVATRYQDGHCTLRYLPLLLLPSICMLIRGIVCTVTCGRSRVTWCAGACW